MSDRKKAIERLRAVEFTDEMDSFGMLSTIGRAVWPGAIVWTPLVCRIMCDELIELLEDADAEIDAVRHECEERIARVVDDIDAVRHEYSNKIVEILEREDAS